MFDLADIDSMDGYELCQKAEEMSFDLEQFRIEFLLKIKCVTFDPI